MKILLKLAWRNLWRNKRRTLINLAAMSTSCASLMVAIGLTQGLLDELQRNVTEVLCGDAQVHAQGFLAERSIELTIAADTVARVREAARARGVAAAPRTIGYGLIAHGARSAGVELVGIEPEAEREFGGLSKRVALGKFLEGPAARKAVLGSRVARSLEVKVGDELVVVVQAADGSTGSMLLSVGGVLDGVGEGTDRTLALVDRKDFAELFATSEVHEIALTGHQRFEAEEVARIAQAAAPQEDVRTWRTLLPQVASIEQIWNVAGWLIGVVFSLAAGLGVLNAMLMAQYERIPEFGLLKALGTTPGRIVTDVFVEALLLGLVSLAVGLAYGGALVHYLHTVGLDIAGAEKLTVTGVAFGSVWRARWSWGVIVQPATVTLLTALFAAVLPSIKAARLDPVKALSHV